MAVDPVELQQILNPSKHDLFMDGIRNDPNSYEDETRADTEAEAVTPVNARNGNVWAAQSTQTSTTNPERPRTRTAGYDRKNYILTVQFRDGTLWNYYDVSARTWDDFRNSPSKNEFIEYGPFAGWPPSSMGPAATSAKQNAAYKGLANIAAKTQKKTYVPGHHSKNKPFGASY